jgi:hypothetical protein
VGGLDVAGRSYCKWCHKGAINKFDSRMAHPSYENILPQTVRNAWMKWIQIVLNFAYHYLVVMTLRMLFITALSDIYIN